MPVRYVEVTALGNIQLVIFSSSEGTSAIPRKDHTVKGINFSMQLRNGDEGNNKT